MIYVLVFCAGGFCTPVSRLTDDAALCDRWKVAYSTEFIQNSGGDVPNVRCLRRETWR